MPDSPSHHVLSESEGSSRNLTPMNSHGELVSAICEELERPDEQLVVEERQLREALPEFADWITELLRRAPRGQRVARLRQLRGLLRDYSAEPPLLHALREAARYGLYDLDRVETMILRNIRDDYFPCPDLDDDDQD